MRKREIVFVDDEGFFTKRYREELEEHFEVSYFSSAMVALEYLRENHAAVDGMVLDIMMPPPEDNPPAAAAGLNMGIWVLEQMQQFLDSWTLPVLVLTNRNLAVVSEAVRNLGIPRQFIEIRSKVETPAFFLPQALATLIDLAHRPDGN